MNRSRLLHSSGTLGLLLSVLALLPAAQAQQDAGTANDALRGRVLDGASRAAIADAIVTVRWVGGQGSDTVAHARTLADGTWQVSFSEVGTYQVRARAIGYAPLERVVAIATAAVRAPLVLEMTAVPVSLEEITVTASRRAERLGDAIVPTVVVTERDIAQTGATDVASVLTEQLGIQLDAGVPVGAGAQLQGFGGRRVLVLLDGQPLIGRVNGNLDLARLPTSMVQRIEVVKGPQSTLFGSEAMGGVVNLITRRAEQGEPASVTLTAISGSQGRRDGDVTLLGARGALEYAADVGRHEISLTPGISNDNDTFARRWNGQASLEWTASSSLSLFASAFGLLEEQRYRTGQLYRFSDNDQWSARTGARLSFGDHRLTPLVYASRFTHLSRGSLTTRPASDSGAQDVQELTEVELTYAGPLGRAGIDAGLELRREQITADRVPGGTRSLDVAEPYAQITVPFGAMRMVVGSRVTWSEQWGRSVTPRAALLWRPVESLGLRASLARGFRAPDFKELYLSFVNQAAGYAVEGNPDLQPEHSTSGALSAEWAGARVYAKAEAFHHRYRDFIEVLAADANGTFTYGNVGAGTARGGEVQVATTAGIVRAEAGYAYLRTRDDATGDALLGRPAHSGRLTLQATPRRLPRLSVTALYTGESPIARDEEGRVTSVQAPYTRIDVRLAHNLPGALTLMLGADNIFDQQLGSEWPGYTGRRVYAGATWRPLPFSRRPSSDPDS